MRLTIPRERNRESIVGKRNVRDDNAICFERNRCVGYIIRLVRREEDHLIVVSHDNVLNCELEHADEGEKRNEGHCIHTVYVHRQRCCRCTIAVDDRDVL